MESDEGIIESRKDAVGTRYYYVGGYGVSPFFLLSGYSSLWRDT